MKLIARRKDLSFKSAYKLASLRLPIVVQELSKEISHEAVQRTLLITHANDRIVVSNVLGKIRNLNVINKYIKLISEDDKMDGLTATYLGRRISENPILGKQELTALIKSGKSVPELIMKHPNFDKEIFETLLLKLKMEDLSEKVAICIVANPLIKHFENVVKLIILSRKICSKKVILSTLNNYAISSNTIDFAINIHIHLIANDSELLQNALVRCFKEEQIEKIINEVSPDVIDGATLDVIVNSLSSKRLKSLYNVICTIADAKEYSTVISFVKHIPTQYWEEFYKKASRNCAIYMLKSNKCPKSILSKAASSTCYNKLIAILNNANCDKEIAVTIYNNIKFGSCDLTFEKRRTLFRLIYEKFGKDLLEQVWNNNCTTNRELYSIFTLTSIHEVKCMIAERITGEYLRLVEGYIVNSQNEG